MFRHRGFVYDPKGKATQKNCLGDLDNSSALKAY